MHPATGGRAAFPVYYAGRRRAPAGRRRAPGMRFRRLARRHAQPGAANPVSSEGQGEEDVEQRSEDGMQQEQPPFVARRRFIAGAVCPRCAAMDKLVVDLETDTRSCVACGFSEARPGDPLATGVAELPTRVSRASARRVETQAQVVRLLDPLPNAADSNGDGDRE